LLEREVISGKREIDQERKRREDYEKRTIVLERELREKTRSMSATLSDRDIQEVEA